MPEQVDPRRVAWGRPTFFNILLRCDVLQQLGALVPAACLSELIRVGVAGFTRARQVASVLLWGALFAFPFVFVLILIPSMRDEGTFGYCLLQ